MIKISAVTKYPQKQQTTDGGKFRPFLNLKNLKTKSTKTFANTELVQGKSKPLNRPGTVTVSNFKCGLPTGSLVTKITVHYAHAKVAYNGKVCNVGAPKISLMDGNSIIKNSKKKDITHTGQAPTTTIKKYTETFNVGSWDYTKLNSSNFGVRINYPTNSSNDAGYIRLYYVYITVDYREPSFDLKVNGDTKQPHNYDKYSVVIELSNKNVTSTAPAITITAPTGLSLSSYSDISGGTFEKVANNTWLWTPKITKQYTLALEMIFDINITFPLGATSFPITFRASESLTGKSARYDTSVLPAPTKEDVDTENTPSGDINTGMNSGPATKTEVLILKEGELPDVGSADYNFHMEYELEDLEQYDDTQTVYIWSEESQALHFYQNAMWKTYIELTIAELKTMGGIFETWVSGRSGGLQKLQIVVLDEDDNEIVLAEQYIEVIPANLTTPSMSVLIPSQEELNRLGDGEVYTVQTFLKNITSLDWVSDWGRNFRIGVFNNAIEDNITVTTITPEDPNEDPYDVVTDSTDYYNLTSDEIFDNAKEWSNTISYPNQYANLECKFAYNKKYPLYILITGDYSERSSKQSIKFTEPCLIEDNYYEVREVNGTYPIPIDNTVLSDGSFAELNMQGNSTATPVIYYDLPLEDFENETHAVRGIEVTGTIEQNSDDLNIYAKVITPNGESRARSINLDVSKKENEFSIGGMGDLWGLSTTDITSLEDWEVEFMVDNTLNGYDGSINYSNISVIFYIAEIDQQNYRSYVNGEDISYYGAFIKDVEIPEGLKTDVDYLTISGTDTNDPYRQNIREKDITIELDIGDNCSLENSTLSVRDLARLFQNKRDKYNRPIPNRIEFSHYPDVYWEYIMEDTFDNKVEINSYGVKIKLTIPSGTAYKKQSTTTNKVGYVNGLASVNPVIVIKPTDNLITVTETLTDQNFHMGYDGDITDKVFVIDCEDRIVWLKQDEDSEDGENITAYVDWNSDWFAISGEYQFEATGAVIKAVDYIERW